MKAALPLALLLSVFAAPAFAAADNGMDHGAMPMASAKLSEGTVKKVDKAGGKLTLAHGPLENLNMPGMTMSFKVKDPAWLDRFKEGDKVRFRVESVNGAFTVVHIEAAK